LSNGNTDTVTSNANNDTTAAKLSNDTTTSTLSTQETDSLGSGQTTSNTGTVVNNSTTTEGTPSAPSGTSGEGGYAGNYANIIANFNSNNGVLYNYLFSKNNFSGAAAAESGFAKTAVAYQLNMGRGTYVGSTWASNTITWSAASASSLFSRQMSGVDVTTLQQAFTAWSQATGLKFQQVVDSTNANIRVGWSDLDTQASYTVGLTSMASSGSSFSSNSLIRIEDTNLDPLVTNSDGSITYTGSGATLLQVMMHEVGHALGLGDNTLTGSIDNFYLTTNNRSINTIDMQAVQSLYPSAAATLTQGMAGFAVYKASQSQLGSGSTSQTSATLAHPMI